MTLERARQRRGFTLVELAIASALLLALTVWAVPRLTGLTGEVSSRSAQADIDQAVSASMSARREAGTFLQVKEDPNDPTDTRYDLRLFDPDLVLLPGHVAPSEPGIVSVHTTAAAPTAIVGFAALDGDGWCWMLARSFGAGGNDVLYTYRATEGMEGYADGFTCTGQAALEQPSPSGADATSGVGSAWTRAYRPGGFSDPEDD